MARRIPEHRFDGLVRTATEVFIARGYRHTQMADVAEALGVAKGTLYGYVESKEALFGLCLAHADRPGRVVQPARLPVPTPEPGELLRRVQRELALESELPALSKALRKEPGGDARTELEAVLREQYSVIERHQTGIKLLDRCSDHPEIGPEWQKSGRAAGRDRVTAYLESRTSRGVLRPLRDVRVAGRIVIETIATWAMHIKWDSSQRFADDVARDTAIEFMLRGLLPD